MYAPSLAEVMIVLGVLILMGIYLAIWRWALSGPAATGERPLTFSAKGLPEGLKLDEHSGQITGQLSKPGEYAVTFHAKNKLGTAEQKFKIICGAQLALTPPMGWNSWNCFAHAVSADKVKSAADALVKSGLINHGWTYINIDDAWQGKRGGPFNGIQGNDKFPDMKGLCDQLHKMGLKAGLYSTPWTTSYATYIGGSSENPEGTWSKPTIPKRGNVNKKILPWAIGKYSFATADANQWAEWGIDYLKYDWNPIEPPEKALMETPTPRTFEPLRLGAAILSFHLNCSAPLSRACRMKELVAWGSFPSAIGGPNGALPSGALMWRSAT